MQTYRAYYCLSLHIQFKQMKITPQYYVNPVPLENIFLCSCFPAGADILYRTIFLYMQLLFQLQSFVLVSRVS